MADQAKVTSTEALETFRARLIIFITRAHRSLDETGDEVRRTRVWLQGEQRMHWENELRKRNRVLAQAEQELFSARLSSLRDTRTIQQAAVRKAKLALAEAEEKLRAVKQWNLNFDGLADPLVRRLEGLRDLLNQDLPKALSFLLQAQKTLESYAETGTAGLVSAPATPMTEPAAATSPETSEP